MDCCWVTFALVCFLGGTFGLDGSGSGDTMGPYSMSMLPPSALPSPSPSSTVPAFTSLLTSSQPLTSCTASSMVTFSSSPSPAASSAAPTLLLNTSAQVSSTPSPSPSSPLTPRTMSATISFTLFLPEPTQPAPPSTSASPSSPPASPSFPSASPSSPPASPSSPSASPLSPPTTSSTDTDAPASSVSVILIAGAAGGVAVTLALAILTFSCCCCCCVRYKGKRKPIVLETADDHHYHMYQAGDSAGVVDQLNLFSGKTCQEGIMNFEVSTTDTFGIKPLNSPEKSASGNDLPALVFISAVDPTIPVSSNKGYANTMPSRQKVQRTEILPTSFEEPSNSKESLLSAELKASKSTGAINRVLTSQPLREIQLQELTKQKANTECLLSPVCIALKTTESQSGAQINASSGPSDGYVLMEAIGKPLEKQVVSSSTAATVAGAGGYPEHAGVRVETKQSEKLTSESLYDIPKPTKQMKEEKVSRGISCESRTITDTSHYDVPRQLLQNKAATLNQGSAKNVAEQPPPTPASSLKEHGSISKCEGIYDVPRSLKEDRSEHEASKTLKSAIQPANSSGIEGRTGLALSANTDDKDPATGEEPTSSDALVTGKPILLPKPSLLMPKTEVEKEKPKPLPRSRKTVMSTSPLTK